MTDDDDETVFTKVAVDTQVRLLSNNGTCFKVMTSILQKINWVKTTNLYFYKIRSDISQLKMPHLVKTPHHVVNFFFILASLIYQSLLL